MKGRKREILEATRFYILPSCLSFLVSNISFHRVPSLILRSNINSERMNSFSLHLSRICLSGASSYWQRWAASFKFLTFTMVTRAPPSARTAIRRPPPLRYRAPLEFRAYFLSIAPVPAARLFPSAQPAARTPRPRSSFRSI